MELVAQNLLSPLAEENREGVPEWERLGKGTLLLKRPFFVLGHLLRR